MSRSKLNIEDSNLRDSLAIAIIKDVEKIKTWETDQKEIYICFFPSPPHKYKILKMTSERVRRQTGVYVSWGILKKTREDEPDQIYATVFI